MLPPLIIKFRNKIDIFREGDPIYEFHLTGEERVVRPETIHPEKIRGYSPGGVIFSSEFVLKIDDKENAIYLRSCWELKIEKGGIEIIYEMPSRRCRFFISERMIRSIEIFYLER